MAVVGEEPLESDAQDIVVIIDATSRHGARGDTATIITSTLVGDEIIQLIERREVVEENDQFALHIVVPIRGTALNPGAPWTATVLLPPSKADDYAVQLLDASSDSADVSVRVLTDTDSARQIVLFNAVGDPALDILWKLLNLKG